MVHNLIIDRAEFHLIQTGLKRFIIIHDDFAVNKGDIFNIIEFYDGLTGNSVEVEISDISKGFSLFVYNRLLFVSIVII
jgi:hypothetical protein